MIFSLMVEIIAMSFQDDIVTGLTPTLRDSHTPIQHTEIRLNPPA